MKRNHNGSVLVWAIVGLAAIGAAALILPNLVQRSFKGALDEMKRFELRLLADDINEFAKYLILYEKIFYNDRPTQLDNKIRNIWGQSFASSSEDSDGMMRACGGYELSGSYKGEHVVGTGGNKEPVFCPLYLRSNMFSGQMIEQMLFENWFRESDKHRKKISEGHYSLTLDLTTFLRKYQESPEDMILLLENKKGSKDSSEDGLKKLIRDTRPEVKVNYEFFTDSSGFRSMLSERYVRVTTELVFAIDSSGTQGVIRSSDTLMVLPSTPKEFALFMPYPTKNDASFSRSSKWSEAVVFPSASSDSDKPQIHGRVFFNGDMDFPNLDSIPIFFDSVVISGSLTIGGKIPGPASLAELQKFFRKGIVTNFSANRFVLDGQCGNLEVSNVSEFACSWSMKPPTSTIPSGDFSTKLNSLCYDGTLSIPDGGPATYTAGPRADAMCKTSFVDTPLNRDSLISGGISNLVVNSKYAFIASPVGKLINNSTTEANIYGTLFAGHVRFVAKGARLYSFTAMRAGLTGINNQDQLQRINQQIVTAVEGVTVPLLSMPVIYSGKSSFLAPPVGGP